MEILSVSLKNFKAHSDCQFLFKPGTNAISGENGAGKTSILEAIAWVLFDYKGDYKVEDLIRNGAAVGQATVTFISSRDGRTYEVVRNSRSGYTLYDPQLGQKLNYTRIREEVLPWLREHLGVSPGTDLAELFASTIGVPQGTFTADFLLTTEKRKPVFDRVLKVEEYLQTWKQLNSLEKYAKTQTDQIDSQIARYDEDLQDFPALTAQQSALVAEIEQAQLDLAHWQQQVSDLQAQQAQAAAQMAQLQQLTGEIQQLTTQIQSQQQQQQRLQAELDQAQQSVEICQVRRSAYQAVLQVEPALQALEQQRQTQQSLIQQRQGLEKQRADRAIQLATLAHQLDRCAAAAAELAQLQPLIQQQTESEQQRQTLQQQLQVCLSVQPAIRRGEQRLAQIERQQQQLAQTLEQLQALAPVMAQIPQLEAQQQRYQQQLSRIAAAQQFESDLRQIVAQADQRGAIHNQQIAGATKTLQELQAWAASAAPLIKLEPVLTALQNGTKFQGQLRADLQGILDDLAEQVLADRLTTQLAQIQIQIQTARQQQAQYLTLDAKHQEQERLQAEAAEAQSHQAQLQTQLAAAPNLQAHLAQLTTSLEELADPAGRSRFLQREIQQQAALVQQQQTIQATLAESAAVLDGIEAQLATLADLSEQIQAQQAIRDLHKQDYTLYLEHQQSANSYKSRHQDYTTATEQLEILEQQAQQRLAQQSALSTHFDPQALLAIQTNYQAAQTQQVTLSAQLPEKQKRLADYTAQLAKLEAVQTQRTAAQVELKQKQRADRFIKFARKAYKEAGPRITERYVQSISHEADKLFRELLNRPNVALEWTRDYEILVREGANTRRLLNLSGGEQMCAALAVRLALLKVLADINIAFFDEPTTNMDRPRRLQLAAAIANIKTFRQLFVISHDDTFEQVTENVILVTRES
jgi:DNA repair protein SbcC/Rad50